MSDTAVTISAPTMFELLEEIQKEVSKEGPTGPSFRAEFDDLVSGTATKRAGDLPVSTRGFNPVWDGKLWTTRIEITDLVSE